MSLKGELQLQNGEAWIELFELDLTALGGPVYRFVPETNAARQPIVWQGNTYNPLPIAAEGFAHDGTGRAPRPKLRAANPAGVFSALAAQYGDFVRAKLVRKRTKVKYLDAVNFSRLNLLFHSENFYSNAWFVLHQVSKVAPDQVVISGTGDPYVGQPINIGSQIGGKTFNFSVFAKTDAPAPGKQLRLFIYSQHAEEVYSQPFGDLGVDYSQCAMQATFSPLQVSQLIIFRVDFEGGGWSSGDRVWLSMAQANEGAALSPYQKTTDTWNPSSDPDAHLDDDIFYVTRKSSEFPILELELGSPMELPGVSLPRRQIIANTCAWRYRSGECGYAGGPVANEFDQPTAVLAQDKCSHTVNGCKLRFGANAEMPFGGFPGASGIPR